MTGTPCPITVVGAGLAGCEAAWQAANCGAQVTLVEMKPARFSPAHHSLDFAELVCSNSLRAEGLTNAVGLLKEEMRRLDSLILACADATRVPAGGALAVDRAGFSRMVTEKLEAHPCITVERRELSDIPAGPCVVATGPLTDGAMAEAVVRACGGEAPLHFYDAAAPIVTAESLDFDKVYFAARYGKGGADYINCPMTKEEYDAFYDALLTAEPAEVHGFEKSDPHVFEGCMPVEVMAARGRDTLRFGPLKPVGLPDPRTGREPYAVVQLRHDDAAGGLYNLVGFQTHLRFPEQKRVFSMIPGLERAEFVRYGVMHRNTFLNAPGLLDRFYRLKSDPRVFFAGQMTGVEGYLESAASGLDAGLNCARQTMGLPLADFTEKTAIGALAHYISGADGKQFQPMNVNFGIIAPLEKRVKAKRARYEAVSARALETLDTIRAAW
ncbi:methylenetetrahydrofolate--tRNA-(uracil(54)-C(5))-methyltransferase (FADH(2)-oxidizing) TrmFO [Ethanoligenens harbinense]|uniref:Methylenetetrahydrofolate--tRNA-(uracil-5-)-methyltransferase TrmFO n=1 Tax=Ethanoligenens harbinense (strain DSM 18485 / JCM 12961 / CGMCC 1.5033 / YUAN-3) TaxID=663278 RepID=E6U7W8_ETHHY|nr:methylenetetrahydrofolate--tRNA-(uracil(54)-C(5))-methyltransferase (FADH(2)-oxidizing) TrmFO [Ethanoligenens harbinense]ADU25900.1 gid protein [Ethanoligenens harbinense YUAN-3]AVQ95057.1 FADH(2)-oxidizing methylenetetrahydrofolate--tRNA-(uracil(54)-C(5))-methyltransferase TrmFO [Ethanoligenens harbinense YUAN-3]AYF37748.1 FADH(2)-oxidizing methylenetetrahydrofolate--tRNA-(uracil(54)-C(5))-methyltransferase TrmFO [Ethanoligenens harbinense]AYF40469.1 FADH(2)-oxidizing methylenetetrahydrofol